MATGGSAAIAERTVEASPAAAVATYKAVVADAGAPRRWPPRPACSKRAWPLVSKGRPRWPTAVQHLLGGDGPSSAVTQMMSAVSDFRVSDSAYQLFTTDFPKLGVTMPASAWSSSADNYQPQAAQCLRHEASGRGDASRSPTSCT